MKELEQKLLTPQPEEKKVSQYKLYQCEWAEGDVYAYPLTSEYAKEKGIGGQYFLFHKIGETIYWPGHTIPVVRVKITKDKALPRTSREFDELQYVQTFRKKYEANGLPLRGECQVNGKKAEPSAMGNLEFFPEYRLILINTSKRIIPKDLVYIGNFKDIAPPPIEYIPEDISISGFLWKFFDKCMIDRYYDLR